MNQSEDRDRDRDGEDGELGIERASGSDREVVLAGLGTLGPWRPTMRLLSSDASSLGPGAKDGANERTKGMGPWSTMPHLFEGVRSS